MQNEQASTIAALAAEVKDEAKPEQERRDALRHMCQLRGEPSIGVIEIPAEQLRFVAAALVPYPAMGFRGLSLKDAMESVRDGFAQRGAGSMRR